MKQLVQQIVKTPLGSISLVTLDDKLCALDFEDYESRMHKLLARYRGEYRLAQGRDGNGIAERVRAYFGGDLHAIDDIEVETGGTEFQQQCWQALRTIAAGTTASYGEQAMRIGKPKSFTTSKAQPLVVGSYICDVLASVNSLTLMPVKK